MALSSTEFLKAIIYPRSTIPLVAKFAFDVLEVFYAEPLFRLDAWFRGWPYQCANLLFRFFVFFQLYAGEFERHDWQLRPGARQTGYREAQGRWCCYLVHVHQDNSWNRRSWAGPCRVILPTYQPTKSICLCISRSLPVEICSGGNAVMHVFKPVWESSQNQLSYSISINHRLHTH